MKPLTRCSAIGCAWALVLFAGTVVGGEGGWIIGRAIVLGAAGYTSVTNAELNLAHHVRLGISGSYRFLSGTDAVGFNPSRLSGPAAALTLRFGQF